MVDLTVKRKYNQYIERQEVMIKFVLGMFFGMWLATQGIDNVVGWMQNTVKSAIEFVTKEAKENFVDQIDKEHFNN